MTKRIIAISISVFALMQQFSATAQTSKDTVIKGSTIEIIQAYKPEVKQAPKPQLQPSLPPVDTSKPRYDYNVPEQTVKYTYNSLPLSPLALGVMPTDTPFANYIKLGGGNLSTIYLDAGIGGIKSDDYTTSFHVQHLSQKGDIEHQKTSATSLDAKGTYYKDDNAINASIGVSRNAYNRYGYDHDVYNYNKDSVNQTYTGVNLNLGLVSNQMGYKKLTYSPNVGIARYGDNNDASEFGINISAPFTYDFDSTLQVYFGADAHINQFKNNLGKQSNNIIQFYPGIKLNTAGVSLRAGVYPTIGTDKFYWLPDVEASFRIPKSQFGVTLGWVSKLRQNTYQYLSGINPYMSNLYTINQTKTTEVFGELHSNISKNMSFSGRVSWWQYNNLPLFVNDTATDGKQFNLVYDDKVNALSLQASVRYQIAQTFALGVHGQWNNFYNNSFTRVWHTPAVTMGVDLSFMPIKNLTITSGVVIMDEIYALTANNNSVKLKTIVDISAGAEYTIVKRLGVFLKLNNLLNNHYQRWYGYDAYGLNAYGGVKFNF